MLHRHSQTVNSNREVSGEENIMLLTSERFFTLTVKCFRRRVWETRHSGVTGWELLSHFSGVWCSSSLQLTRSSKWQRESLFHCQMRPHWRYVPNNIVWKENKSRLTWAYIILHVHKITLPQRYSTTADIRHWEALIRARESKILSSAGLTMPRIWRYLH
jgi:hypothetical protein